MGITTGSRSRSRKPRARARARAERAEPEQRPEPEQEEEQSQAREASRSRGAGNEGVAERECEAGEFLHLKLWCERVIPTKEIALDTSSEHQNSDSASQRDGLKPSLYTGADRHNAYVRNTEKLSVADIRRLEEVLDAWTQKVSRSVEKQVNHTLVGLAGVTIASASENASIPLTGGNGDNKAPKNVATNSKSATATLSADRKPTLVLKPRSELFNVADMEYTLAELVKETKSNDRELLKSLLKSHEAGDQ